MLLREWFEHWWDHTGCIWVNPFMPNNPSNATHAYVMLWKHNLEIHAYIYIYIYICVCQIIKFISRRAWLTILKDPLHSLKIRQLTVGMLCSINGTFWFVKWLQWTIILCNRENMNNHAITRILANIIPLQFVIWYLCGKIQFGLTRSEIVVWFS